MSPDPAVPPAVPPPSAELTRAIAEIEAHVAAGGWDQPARLYALVDTAELLAHQPHLAGSLGVEVEARPGALTPIEQEAMPAGPLDEALAAIAWPAEVLGAAIVHEVITLPPSADAEAAELVATEADLAAVAAWAAAHPERREIRLAVAVLRDGSQASAVRKRSAGNEAGSEEVLVGADLAPNLAAALLATLV